jgi:cysteine desulfurase
VAIYLDHAATTPVRAEVVEVMLPWLTGGFANPSGAHRLARRARRAIDDARDQFAAALGCQPGDVVFTSGGTESDNLAVRGVLDGSGGVAVCTAVEHPAVLQVVEAAGGRLVQVDASGRVDLDRMAAALNAEVSVVSVMTANNEVGTIQPVAEVVELVRQLAPGALVHTDAVQAAGWLDLRELMEQVDLLSLSAHKLGGPQGVGALVVRTRDGLAARQVGGGQERGVRSGTHNTAGIVGAGRAIELAAASRDADAVRVGALADGLRRGLRSGIPDVVDTSAAAGDRRLPGIVHVCIPGVESEALLFMLEGEDLYASAASSCASGAQQSSHVLAAMGVDPALSFGALRLSLGHSTTQAEIDRAVALIPPEVRTLRGSDRTAPDREVLS